MKILISIVGVIVLVAGPILFGRYQFFESMDAYTENFETEKRFCDGEAHSAAGTEFFCDGKTTREKCIWGDHYLGVQRCEIQEEQKRWQKLALISNDKLTALRQLSISEATMNVICESPFERRFCAMAESEFERYLRKVERAD